jgi:Domain of unknown function (DUF1996)
MNARVLVVALVLPLFAAIVVSTALAGRDGKGRESMAQLRGVNFVSSCTFSHRAPDDPIVFFGQPGASHDHSFVGNTGTNASSTLESLLANGTTCHRPGDTAAYWMPTLYVNGQAVTPNHAQIYYRRKTMRHVEAFPPGFRMVAGDAKATSAQPLRVTFWNCGVGAGIAPTSTVPTCPDARRNALRLHVTFPSCWDGKNLDSASHQSHVMYPIQGRCPSKFAHALPQISLIYRYPTTGAGNVFLASGGQVSGHADFFNGWRQSDLQALVDGCLNALRHCQRAA